MATKVKKKVNKMLSPEEKTLIDNLKAMISELESMEAGGLAGDDGVADALKAVESMAGTAPNEELGGVETPDLEAAQRKKELLGAGQIMKEVSTDTDVPPANADADERIDDIPDVDDENIGEVAKALSALLRRKGVGKSAAPDPLMLVAKAIQTIAGRQSVQEDALTKLLQGMGIADQVVAQATVEKEARLPVASGDHDATVNMVAKALVQALSGQSVQGQVADGDKSMEEVRKDMGGVLQTLGQSPLWAVQPGQQG